MAEEDHVLMTRTGPGTPCGDLLRRYWQPAALSEELPTGGAPLPIHLLGEELVLFRDGAGHPGLIGLHCAHRGADLSYGRLEDGGLRCIYHGWLYDIAGRCLEQPGEPAGSTFHERIRQTAYPCVERAGAIFAYLGPGEPPLSPNYDFLSYEEPYVTAIKRYHECNYLQANEGNIDLSHLSFLHYLSAAFRGGEASPDGTLSRRGAAPWQESADAALTPYGVRSCKIRTDLGPDQHHLYVTEFVLPNFTAFWVGPNGDQSGRTGYSVNWHVPIDDTHHWKYTFAFGRGISVEGERRRYRSEMVDYQPVRNKSNRYQQDRASMKNDMYLGIGPDFQVHDKWATEGQGPTQNRAEEHLGAMDLPLVLERKVLLKAIRDIQEGREPANVVRDPSRNVFPIVTCVAAVPTSTDWKAYCDELGAAFVGSTLSAAR